MRDVLVAHLAKKHRRHGMERAEHARGQCSSTHIKTPTATHTQTLTATHTQAPTATPLTKAYAKVVLKQTARWLGRRSMRSRGCASSAARPSAAPLDFVTLFCFRAPAVKARWLRAMELEISTIWRPGSQGGAVRVTRPQQPTAASARRPNS